MSTHSTSAASTIKFKELLCNVLSEKEGSSLISDLFEEFSTLPLLLDATISDFKKIKGVGVKKATQISAALDLFKFNPVLLEEKYVIRDPETLYALVKDMQYHTKENFVVIGLNTKNHVMFKETIFVGSLNASIVHPREVFKMLLKYNCASFCVAHNHPSGDPHPSREDKDVTKRLVECGKIFGIELLDHIIVGHESFYSLKEHGHFNY